MDSLLITWKVRHFKALEHKRLNVAADELNKGSVKEFMMDQHVLTIHCQKVFWEVYERRTEYIWGRVNKVQYLVAHRKTFQSEDNSIPLTKISFQLPNYCNVYTVNVEEEGKFMKCSCQFFHRMGIPCVHVCSILGEIHPKMFHPRYYVMYNSWLYNSIENIQSMCNIMFESFSKSGLGCNIEGIYPKAILTRKNMVMYVQVKIFRQ